VKKLKPADIEYAKEMGADAVDRNDERSETRHPCCWELLEAKHHPLCKNAEPDIVTGPVPGQESLL